MLSIVRGTIGAIALLLELRIDPSELKSDPESSDGRVRTKD